MKHRLPKAKSATLRIESQSEMEQAELLIDENKSGLPSDSGPPLPVIFPSTTPVNETSAADPGISGLTVNPALTPDQTKNPSSTERDSFGSIVDTPPEEAKPNGDTAPAEIKSRRVTPPPLPVKTSRATPPPLPARMPFSPSVPAEVKPVFTGLEPVVTSEKPVMPDPVPAVIEEKPATTEPTPDGDQAIKALRDTKQIIVSDPSIAFETKPAYSGPPPLLTSKSAVADEKSNGPAQCLIRTQGLVKQYGGRRVVNGVDIQVHAGEVVGLLGKNGAGKTTTFYMIVGLVPPTLGHVFMGDEDVTHMPMYRRARRGIGYLPQEESIFRKLTVEENLLAILETLPMTEDEREIRCDELLKDFGLEHVRENVAITLSGGEKRRVTIARALVTSPTLLLLDEPFSGVDPMAVHDIQEIILHLKERGLGVLITDHNVRETLSVVDRAYIIDEGRVLSEGTREFLLNDPIAREIYLGYRFSM
ncbi:MAG: LPS export ABC transporter ATP-binding protein [Methylacidiphilales bacterium]|nr:LPS export ABC transporter ATP-binding protein [Candidatus Methylacidiphilales bacterium]